MSPDRWLRLDPVFEKIDSRITVLRDDLLEGGSKLRFLPFLVEGASEVVYGSPFCGAAALALSVYGRESKTKISIFYAGRKELHPRQKAVIRNGADAYAVRPGYMAVVQKRASAYAERAGALFLPLGFDVPATEKPFVGFLESVRKKIGSPDQIWCATGSGMLARCLGKAFPDSEVVGVAVGLKSRHEGQAFSKNVSLLDAGLPFEKETKAKAPFPSCPNYDRKAWDLLLRSKHSRGSVLFYNVLGPTP